MFKNEKNTLQRLLKIIENNTKKNVENCVKNVLKWEKTVKIITSWKFLKKIENWVKIWKKLQKLRKNVVEWEKIYVKCKKQCKKLSKFFKSWVKNWVKNWVKIEKILLKE